jgi:ribosome-binding factor A
MSSDGRRPRRAAEAIRSVMAGALMTELGDPQLASLVITDVAVTDDLGLARIGVRLMVGDGDPKRRKDVVRRMERVSPKLRRLLGPALGLRRVPEIRFFYDDGHDASQRVDELLREIATDPKSDEELED